MRHNPNRGIMRKLVQQGRIVSFGRRARRGANERFARRQLNGNRRGAIEGSAAAVADGCAGRGNEGLGPFDRRDDGCGRCVDDRRLIAVDLLGGEYRCGASEEAGDRVGVAGLGLGGEFKLLVEDDERGFLALANLSAGLGPLAVSAPDAGAVGGFLGIGPKRHDIDAAIRLLRCDVDGSHDAASGAVPGQAEIARAALDRADDFVGDVLMNIEAFFAHGGSPLRAGRAIAASWGKRDRDQ